MTDSYKLIEEGRRDELWMKHCGFLQLSRQDYMDIQKRRMLEQIKVLAGSKLGNKLLGKEVPKSIDEFRDKVALTDYTDYEEFLEKKNEEVLPVKPYVWARTSGRSSDRGPKWIPYTKAMYDRLGEPVVGAMIMASCSNPEDVRLDRNDKFLLATAPPPYSSAYISRSAEDNLQIRFLPPLDIAEKMGYGERVAVGFKMALKEGLDYFMGISVVLARMGEQFEQQSSSTRPTRDMLHPYVLWRLMKATIKARMNNRSILPRDIWKLKGIMSGGTDTDIYKEKIEYYWGRKPLEGFACTEGGNMAMQGWNYNGMVFLPENAFLEFIPLSEHEKNKKDPSYKPSTVLYDQLDVGLYELVFSNFDGGILVRYRIGDLFEVLAVGDDELGSELPQVRFYSRADDVIDLSSFIRLTERDIWKTIEASGLDYEDWAARKEVDKGETMLHLYIELKSGSGLTHEDCSIKLDKSFTEQYTDYADLKMMLGRNPLLLTLLPQGAFMNYMKEKQKSGADMAHLKPPHMNPTDQNLNDLNAVDLS